MNTIFNNSLNEIDKILSKKFPAYINANENNVILKADTRTFSSQANVPIIYESRKTLIEYDKNFVIENFGLNEYTFSEICIGSHPDFLDLDHTNYIMHHCVSMFVDIKGSTKLVEKYSISDVRLIKDTMISLIILVANQFGGHIQRLQGDGVFISFVRRNREPINSIINALNTSSILTQFISTDLEAIFKKNDIKPLRIRIGLDYGEDKDVLWSYYGLSGCDELTTTSLHTDMAAKLQAKAFDNSILIGNNIVEKLDINKDIISHYYTKEGSREEVFNVTPTLTYKFFVFEWKKYLNQHPNFKLMGDGSLKHKIPSIYLKCSYTLGGNTINYFPNSKGIPKGSSINFTLMENDREYIKKGFEEIKWTIYNTGKEAILDQCISQEVDDKSKNLSNCSTTARYLGLHKIQCKLIRTHSDNMNFEFPVIVY